MAELQMFLRLSQVTSRGYIYAYDPETKQQSTMWSFEDNEDNENNENNESCLWKKHFEQKGRQKYAIQQPSYYFCDWEYEESKKNLFSWTQLYIKFLDSIYLNFWIQLQYFYYLEFLLLLR